jgi:hypothetical protein
MRQLDYAELRTIMGEQPYPLLCATVSGAHLYGFPSRDSDVDLRGVHVLPADEVVGLRTGPETLDHTWFENEAEVDLVTHDPAKFARLMLRRNGYVLEQVLSPLVVISTPEHDELVELAAGCVTKWHAHHYRGFAKTQWEFFLKKRELKPLLYTFRVLLTGIHLMREAQVQADLTRLTAYGPSYLPGLVEAKVAAEHGTLPLDAPPQDVLRADVEALTARLEEERERSALPEQPTARRALHELVVRARLG